MNSNAKPILVKTFFYTVRVEQSAKPLGRGQVTSIIIKNPLIFPDGTVNSQKIIVGDGAGMLWDLLPGQVAPEIFTNDLKDVYARLLISAGDLTTAIDVPVMAHRDAIPTRTVGEGR